MRVDPGLTFDISGVASLDPVFILLISVSFSASKFTSPGARDKYNFNQGKHIFSSNLNRQVKNTEHGYFSLNAQCYLATGQVKI